MFGSGSLVEEAERSLGNGVSVTALAASGIGYAEAIDVIEGRRTVEAAAGATLHRTARYAKAQRTYFRRDSRIRWLRPDVLTPDDLLATAIRLAREGGVASGEAATQATAGH
jgi:tRNA dimethylallyltransferase